MLLARANELIDQAFVPQRPSMHWSGRLVEDKVGRRLTGPVPPGALVKVSGFVKNPSAKMRRGGICVGVDATSAFVDSKPLRGG
jgi:hypothetical protein